MVYANLPTLTTPRLVVRMATRSDVAALLDYHLENKAFLTPFEPEKPDNFYTKEFWRIQIDKAITEFSYEQSLRLCLFPAQKPKHIIGKINFTQVYRGAFHSCTLGYSLSESAQGQGYMTEALTESIHYIFKEFNLHRIMANYMPHNRRSGQLLRRLGFTVEGYARDYLLINGRWEDHVLTSLTNPQWKSFH